MTSSSYTKQVFYFRPKSTVSMRRSNIAGAEQKPKGKTLNLFWPHCPVVAKTSKTALLKLDFCFVSGCTYRFLLLSHSFCRDYELVCGFELQPLQRHPVSNSENQPVKEHFIKRELVLAEPSFRLICAKQRHSQQLIPRFPGPVSRTHTSNRVRMVLAGCVSSRCQS